MRFFYSVWIAFYSFITLLFVFPFYELIYRIENYHKKFQRISKISRIWAWFLQYGLFIRFKVENKHLLNQSESYVIISNHRSYLDIPICARCTLNSFRFLAKIELVSAPILGRIIKKSYITIDRDNSRSAAKAFVEMKKTLKSRTSVWIYPEGSRNNTQNTLLPFNDGAFHIAQSTESPIAICAIWDTGAVLPKNFIKSKPKTIKAKWVKIITKDEVKNLDIESLKNYCYKLLEESILELQNA
jgi:1-acyl-sn-glycerol-3-phosphate acyltransferase